MKIRLLLLLFALMAIVSPSFAQAKKPDNPAESVRKHLASVDKRLLEMAKDFPEDKYDFKLKPEMRSFGEVLVHLVSGNIFAAERARGKKDAQWGELDAKNYKTKADVVALLEKHFADSEAALKTVPDAAFTKSVDPYLSVIEHNGEHYGMLVTYYRANGMVPPASRQQ
jgi:hypothetical protein